MGRFTLTDPNDGTAGNIGSGSRDENGGLGPLHRKNPVICWRYVDEISNCIVCTWPGLKAAGLCRTVICPDSPITVPTTGIWSTGVCGAEATVTATIALKLCLIGLAGQANHTVTERPSPAPKSIGPAPSTVSTV